jgi:hypothetical protein
MIIGFRHRNFERCRDGGNAYFPIKPQLEIAGVLFWHRRWH